MLALYAPSPSAINGMAFDQEYRTNDLADSSPFHHLDLPCLQQQQQQQQQLQLLQGEVAELDPSPPSTAVTGDPTIIKKLSHNASERDRRKKINCLYSSLRSLLPAADQMKKLSNPATISRTLKYIPELQNQVQGLIQKKEELLSSISRKVDLIYQERHKKSSAWRSLSNVSASRLNDRELVLQISTFKVQKTPLSHILVDLEEDGFSLLNATSFESFGGRVFYSLHLQVERITDTKGTNNFE
ncbi:Basic helix-loop-helix transcription factor [Trema orientale]|uniref:Basic helix-loop-helix transcription factor n=1 Tax=Trema orientale TaxID=63057 RepID=A0A2P5ETL5_TREOI|nr:Basic helix-loop-helix transcription factor [Trema orientale]